MLDGQDVLQIDPLDNVVVAIQDLEPGSKVGYESVVVVEPIPAKHKVALRDFAVGDSVIMYGVTVGRATTPIVAGGLLHTANIEHAAQAFDLADWQMPVSQVKETGLAGWSTATFDGYHRSDGRVGTQNVWLVMPLVFCENKNIDLMRQAMLEPLGYEIADRYRSYVEALCEAEGKGDDLDAVVLNAVDAPGGSRLFPHVDGIKFLDHTMGCGSDRHDAESLARLLVGYIAHPNVAGVTVLSLGCQHVQIAHVQDLLAQEHPRHDRPVLFFEQQRYDCEQSLIRAAIRATFEGLRQANENRRTPAPLSALCIGTECGASDGFSGISSNPLIGQVADVLVSVGGQVILSEFPELCGVEKELVQRCATRAHAERFVDLMCRYSDRAQAVGSDFSANPSPGNLRDGLITDAIKSAGAARKGGSSLVQDVLDYTETVTQPGLTLLCTPGNDVESTTALAASGANMILFSTGLGTPTGNAVTPVVKIASNSALSRQQQDMIDFNAGQLIDGTSSLADMREQLLRLVIDVASGRQQTHAQRRGQDDFIPWKRGVSL